MAMSSSTVGQELLLDEAIIKALPAGVQAQSAHSYGTSSFSTTAKIAAADVSNKPTSFFVKYITGSLAKSQVEGEFIGMVELHALAPNLVPKPIARGRLKESISTTSETTDKTATYFLITEFKDFVSSNELPDAKRLGLRLAALHRRSALSGRSGGRFGFDMQTYDGSRVQTVGWQDRWTPFFTKLLAEAYRQDTETNGVWPELDVAYKRVQSRLIPRLIGALEVDGRSVMPVLIHGDLWDGNVGVERDTGDPWIFDCGVYYAHNEMELGIWRAERHRLKAEEYRAEYFRHFEPSEPKEECDDRNRLYSAKTNFMHSAIFPGSPARRAAYNDFLYLIEKYVPWEEEEVMQEPTVEKHDIMSEQHPTAPHRRFEQQRKAKISEKLPSAATTPSQFCC